MQCDITGLQTGMEHMQGQITTIQENMLQIKNTIDKMQLSIDRLEIRVSDLESQVENIHIILENEIRVNIQRIAEGHLDLYRKFAEAAKPSEELGLLCVKVNILETDVRMLKQKIS